MTGIILLTPYRYTIFHLAFQWPAWSCVVLAPAGGCAVGRWAPPKKTSTLTTWCKCKWAASKISLGVNRLDLARPFVHFTIEDDQYYPYYSFDRNYLHASVKMGMCDPFPVWILAGGWKWGVGSSLKLFTKYQRIWRYSDDINICIISCVLVTFSSNSSIGSTIYLLGNSPPQCMGKKNNEAQNR